VLVSLRVGAVFIGPKDRKQNKVVGTLSWP